MTARAVVIKIGGSLLAKPRIPETLTAWLSCRQRDRPAIVIAGGGAQVDVLREQHARGALGDEAAHWAAIDVMDVNARSVADWVGLPVVEALPEAVGRAGDLVFAAGRFLREEEPNLSGVRLPIGWSVTSDSIAARVAALISGDLVLLKSAPPPAGVPRGDWAALAKLNYVDEFFPSASLAVLGTIKLETLE